jgi:hypothetical protein
MKRQRETEREEGKIALSLRALSAPLSKRRDTTASFPLEHARWRAAQPVDWDKWMRESERERVCV